MIGFLAGVIAAGAAAAAPAPVDPTALAAATVLVQQLDVRGQVMRSMAQTIQVMRSGAAMRSMLAQQPGFIPAYQANKARFDPALQKAGAIQAEIAEKVVRANVDQVVAEAARIYARSFSAAELKGLSDFYRTPLGQALNQRSPRVSAEVSAANGSLIGSKLDTAMQSAAPRIQAALAPLNPVPPAKKQDAKR